MLQKTFNIEGAKVGAGAPAFIIAEAGVNHNGDIELAKKLVLEAKRSGADCVKFQTFTTENLLTRQAPKAAYQKIVTDASESQFDMLKKLELSYRGHVELMALCRKQGIIFLSTPYNFTDVDLLEKIGVSAYKLASMHLTELPTVEYVARKDKPLILSTGMSLMPEIQAAAAAFEQAGNSSLALMQCTTEYPAAPEEINLRAMAAIGTATGAVIGYSDHSSSGQACVLAVAMGAKVIEKHFTLDKKMPGPDHSSSAEPGEFLDMVKKIREAEKMLGSESKTVTASERRNMVGMRRSLVAVLAIPAGQSITAEMLSFKRPATGLPPNSYNSIIGKKARRNIEAGTILTENDIS